MNTDFFNIMRNEIILIVITVISLLTGLFTSPGKQKNLRTLNIILLAIATIVGFLPAQPGTLFGGMYQSSELHIWMKNILNIGVLIVFIQSHTWLNHEDYESKISEFYVLILSTLIGMNFLISSGDFLMFYIGIELATIPIASLAAYDRYRNKSAEAGIKLILSSALSSGIMLWGISMIYGTAGSVFFHDVVTRFSNNSMHVLAFIFFFAGMAFKISIVPFQFWVADVYEGSPVSITSYLSVISKGAAVFIFTITLFTVFKTISYLWKDVIYISAILTMTIGNLFAIRQKNMKRFLAFSSISQAGFILLGIISGTQLGMATVLYYILIYIFSNLGAFGVVSVVSAVSGKETMDDYDSMYKTNPLLSLVMMLSLFSLAGIPPVAGFFGKFFLFTAAAQQGYYILVIIAVLNTIISLYYYLLVIKAMFINKNDHPISYFKSDFFSRLGLVICVAGIVVTGFASFIFEFFRSLCFGL